jgi:lipopolysaccharide export system protein LptA
MKPLQMSSKTKKIFYSSLLAISLITPWFMTSNFNFNEVKAQSAIPKQPLTVRSDIQEANSETGVITARGNVYINYPARDLQATSTQAQYFSRERRLVLTGNVYVLQQGNTMRSESMTYLIDEGRFIATPETKQQVESVYLVDETEKK